MKLVKILMGMMQMEMTEELFEKINADTPFVVEWFDDGTWTLSKRTD